MKPEEFLKKCYENDSIDYGLCSPPTDAQEAIHILANHLLGDDWYIVMPQSQEQCNTDIVYAILKQTQPNIFKRMMTKINDWIK